jgi:hypothetical protein
MAIRDAALDRARAEGNEAKARLLRKANQEWELGGLARQDGDKVAMERHYAEARRLTAEASEL